MLIDMRKLILLPHDYSFVIIGVDDNVLGSLNQPAKLLLADLLTVPQLRKCGATRQYANDKPVVEDFSQRDIYEFFLRAAAQEMV